MQKDFLLEMTLLKQKGMYWNSIFRGRRNTESYGLYLAFGNNPYTYIDSMGTDFEWNLQQIVRQNNQPPVKPTPSQILNYQQREASSAQAIANMAVFGARVAELTTRTIADVGLLFPSAVVGGISGLIDTGRSKSTIDKYASTFDNLGLYTSTNVLYGSHKLGYLMQTPLDIWHSCGCPTRGSIRFNATIRTEGNQLFDDNMVIPSNAKNLVESMNKAYNNPNPSINWAPRERITGQFLEGRFHPNVPLYVVDKIARRESNNAAIIKGKLSTLIANRETSIVIGQKAFQTMYTNYKGVIAHEFAESSLGQKVRGSDNIYFSPFREAIMDMYGGIRYGHPLSFQEVMGLYGNAYNRVKDIIPECENLQRTYVHQQSK